MNMSATQERLSIDIPESAWKPVGGPNGDDYTKLHTMIHLNGANFHLEAFQMVRIDDGGNIAPEDYDGCTVQEPHPDMGADLEYQFREAAVAFYADGPYQTISLFGREYAVFACPGA